MKDEKFILEEDYKEGIYQKIHAMNVIMRSLNDEFIFEVWLEEGVPDGTDTIEDVKDVYGGEDDLELIQDFNDLATLFAKLVRRATNNGYESWIY